MLAQINLDELKRWNLFLYSVVTKAIGHRSGIHSLDISTLQLSEANRFSLAEWSLIQPPTPVPVSAQPVVKEEPTPFLSEEELVERATDQARGFARLQQFVDEQNLEDSPQTASLVDVWLAERGLVWSAANVDKAVLSLKNVLRWNPKVEPTPAKPVEVLGTLPDGTKQLPLSDAPHNKASVAQVKDWLARTREATGKYLRPRGSFSSTF
jgi:hypothetical protein